MRIVSANITGSLILNGVDVTDSLVSSSDISSSVSSKLDSLQSSTSSLNSFTSSYSTGSFTGSFKGDGTNLYNIPATGVTGLQLDKIASGAVTASVSENGFNVNSNVSITGSIVASGTSLVSGSSQINITGTTGYSTFSSSISTSIGSLSSSVATTTNNLSSRVDSIETKSGSYATTGSNTFIGNENITGNLTVTGSVIVSSGSAVYNSSLNLTDTSSLTLNSGSNLYVYDTGIISGTFKGSVTGSLGINGNVSITGSIVASGTSLVSGSSQIDITSTTNYTTFSSSVSSSIGNLSSSVATNTSGLAGRITTIEGRGATTGSNTFVGSQVITGSLYITTDLIVQGSSSLQNITASAVSIGTNTVILNTDTPAVRFAGVSVQDSGSNVGVTGSIFWDGLCNRWVYSNPSGVGYSGGLLISGPRNVGTLGDEVGTTSCALMIGQGGDHITSSAIFHYGNATCFYGTSFISGSGSACFSGQICAPSFVGGASSGTCAIFNTLTAGNSAGASVNISTNGNNGTSETPLQTNLNFYGYNSNLNGQIRVDDISGTAQLGTMKFYTWNSSQVLSLTLGHTGIACFASTVCTPRLQVLNTSSVVTIEGTATNGEGSLTVAGKNSSGTSRSAVFKYDNADVIRISTADAIPMRFETSDVTRMTISSTGISCFACQICAPTIIASTIGIGISNPSGLLHINGTGPTLKLTDCSASGNGGDVYLRVEKTGVGYNNLTTVAFSYNFKGGGSETSFLNIGSTGVSCFSNTVCAPVGLFSGNVGIGCTTPGYVLDVRDGTTGSAGGRGMRLSTCSNSAGPQFRLEYQCSGDSRNWLIGTNQEVAGDFIIRNSTIAGCDPGGASSATRFSINKNGFVSIGGTDAGFKLDIQSPGCAGTAENVARIGNIPGTNNGLLVHRCADNSYRYIFQSGIMCVQNTICTATLVSTEGIQTHGTTKTIVVTKYFNERETGAAYFKLVNSSGNGFSAVIHSMSQNPGIGWSAAQIHQAVTAPYWGGWVGSTSQVNLIGGSSPIISSTAVSNNGCITFYVSTGNNGTNTSAPIVSYIQITAFDPTTVTATIL